MKEFSLKIVSKKSCLLKYFLIFIFIHVYVCRGGVCHMYTGTDGGQMRVSDPHGAGVSKWL